MAYTQKNGGHTTIVLEKSDGKLSEQLSELQAVFNHMADTKMGYNDILMELLARQAKAMTETARGQEKQLERLKTAEEAIAALQRELEALKNPVLDKPKLKAPEGGPSL
jgi:uncharacterized damage-inducible protein DinB